jgi:hypothetical protein
MKHGDLKIIDKHRAYTIPGEHDFDGTTIRGGGVLGFWGTNNISSLQHELNKCMRHCLNLNKNRALAGSKYNG